MELGILTRRRAASIFALLYSPFDVCSFVGVAFSPPCNSSSKQQQSQTDIFAVTVTAVARGRSLYFMFSSAAFQLVSAASNPTDHPPNP